jgi:hypothetical protein
MAGAHADVSLPFNIHILENVQIAPRNIFQNSFMSNKISGAYLLGARNAAISDRTSFESARSSVPAYREVNVLHVDP